MQRLAVVVVVALAGFAAAFVAFGDAARTNCVLDAPPDGAYSAVFEEPVPAGDQQVLSVTRGGEPITGAWVCANLVPTDAPDASVVAEGREIDDGRYALDLGLSAGRWSGTVLIGEEQADGEVAVPVLVEVVGD